MTRAGFDQLDEELRGLKGTERPAVIRAIAEARGQIGDPAIQPKRCTEATLPR